MDGYFREYFRFLAAVRGRGRQRFIFFGTTPPTQGDETREEAGLQGIPVHEPPSDNGVIPLILGEEIIKGIRDGGNKSP